MGLCVFKTALVRRCVEHALKSDKFRMPFSEEKPQPALLFVHDDGVYLMSNGLPADIIVSKKSPMSYAAYAKSCNPSLDDDWWENSRALVGGDDFGEIVLIDKSWLKKCDDYEELHFDVAPEHMDIYFTNERKRKKTVSA
ncbi:DUF3085 domain-containing protein [bacterium]|nr:DUF3085 domain-containing protein [bacterium]